MSIRLLAPFYCLNSSSISLLNSFFCLVLSRSRIQLEVTRVEEGLNQFQTESQTEETAGGLNWDSGDTCFV
jgi:hypothetical protein